MKNINIFKAFVACMAILASCQFTQARTYESDEQETPALAMRDAIRKCNQASDNCPTYRQTIALFDEYPEAVCSSSWSGLFGHLAAEFRSYTFICSVESLENRD